MVGGVYTCLGVSNDAMLLWIFLNSYPLNLPLVRSHQAEIIIVKRLIQERNNETRALIDPRSCNQNRSKNDAFTLLPTLPATLQAHYKRTDCVLFSFSTKIFPLYFIESKSVFCHICSNIFFKELNNNMANEMHTRAIKLCKATSFQYTGTNNTKRNNGIFSLKKGNDLCSLFASMLFVVHVGL